jgi:transcriptional regulator with XRE-family HTH domain
VTPAEITTLRTRLGQTREGLAALLGVHYAQVGRWESGKTEPDRYAATALRLLQQAAGGHRDDSRGLDGREMEELRADLLEAPGDADRIVMLAAWCRAREMGVAK